MVTKHKLEKCPKCGWCRMRIFRDDEANGGNDSCYCYNCGWI